MDSESHAIHPLLQPLNEAQREAVLATDGPLLLLAGAGSGKTKTLTHRIAYLIATGKTLPHQILAVTFTNKAAHEMKKRLFDLMADSERGYALESSRSFSFYTSSLPVVGTFHSICVQILRRHIHRLGFENRFAIFDNTDSEIVMKTIMKELNINTDQMNPKAVLSHISGAKNALLNPARYAQQSHSYFSEKVAQLYPLYQRRLVQNQALDFEDILMKTVELFEQEPDVLNELQERFRFISVDEYQDTNHAQFVFIQKLAEKYRNLCVVGDDWQSIYSWRGATMQNILDFSKNYPEAQTIKLEQNYRSTSVILNASHAVISKNQRRTEKKLWTDREGGEPIEVWRCIDEREEGSLIAQEIQKRLLEYESPQYRDFAVLYRTNAQSRVVEETMIRHGIPYRIIGGVKFYERKEIKDVLAYLRLITNPADTVSLLRIINTPPRKIGAKTLETLQNWARRQGDMPVFSVLGQIEALGKTEADLNEGKITTLKQFVDLITHLQKLNQDYPASGVIKHLIMESKYKDFLLDGSSEGEARFENVQELISVAQKYDSLEPGLSLSTFLEEVALISDLDQLDEQDNAVVMMTLHSAKGLEFPHVFICGLEEGIFPHSRSLLEPGELEEERRLMYVGMTRARDRLYLIHAERRLLYGEIKQNAPSQFLRDIPEEWIASESLRGGEGSKFFIQVEEGEGGILGHYLKRGEQRSGLRRIPMENEVGFYPDDVPAYPEADSSFDTEEPSGPPIPLDFQAGDRVRHRSFGEGVVVNVMGGILTEAFKNKRVGVKKLAASVAPLEKL